MIKLFLTFLLFIFSTLTFAASYDVDEVRVYKTKHRMEMLFKGKITKVYTVMLGRGGMEPKRKEGDKRVPEGKYMLDYKNPYSKFYRSIHITYPNVEDIARAKKMGVKPGGDIFVHGMPEFYQDMERVMDEKALNIAFPLIDWTAGCVAVSNSEMTEIWENVEVPIPITIYH